jgi:ribosome biogenesis protein SSF1/2
MKQRQKKQKKPAPTPIATDEPSELKNAPHSFIIYRGLHCMDMVRLSRDFRRMMEPFTAAQLKERKANRVKDYVSLSGFFHVSHMCLFTRTEVALSMKIIRLPRGPTLTFKVHQYTLAKDVISSMKRQMVDLKAFQTPPLVILNSFSGEGKHLKLMATTFQNMFPPINLTTVRIRKNVKKSTQELIVRLFRSNCPASSAACCCPTIRPRNWSS